MKEGERQSKVKIYIGPFPIYIKVAWKQRVRSAKKLRSISRKCTAIQIVKLG